MAEGIRVGVPMLPTTVFTLVIVEIFRSRNAAPYVVGGLVIYMLVNTLVRSVVLRKAAFPLEDELLLEAQIVPPSAVTVPPRMVSLAAPDRGRNEEA
jgi:hypothetical protein